ncbi:MAG: tetratricopeptide repeat protein [Isosphaeraceae bacterium]
MDTAGDSLGAIASYREAIRLKPDYALAHNNLGATLKDAGDLLMRSRRTAR